MQSVYYVQCTLYNKYYIEGGIIKQQLNFNKNCCSLYNPFVTYRMQNLNKIQENNEYTLQVLRQAEDL